MEGLTPMEKLWASQTFLPKSHPGVFTNHWLNGDSDFEAKVGPLILPFLRSKAEVDAALLGGMDHPMSHRDFNT